MVRTALCLISDFVIGLLDKIIIHTTSKIFSVPVFIAEHSSFVTLFRMLKKILL